MKEILIHFWNGFIRKLIPYTPIFGELNSSNTRDVIGIQFLIDGNQHQCLMGDFTCIINKNDELCFDRHQDPNTGLIQVFDPKPLAMLSLSSDGYHVVVYSDR
jgi:hypothetical protein